MSERPPIEEMSEETIKEMQRWEWGRCTGVPRVLAYALDLKRRLTESEANFDFACKTIENMKTRDPDKRIEELENALSELNSFDAPAEMVSLRMANEHLCRERDAFKQYSPETARRVETVMQCSIDVRDEIIRGLRQELAEAQAREGVAFKEGRQVVIDLLGKGKDDVWTAAILALKRPSPPASGPPAG